MYQKKLLKKLFFSPTLYVTELVPTFDDPVCLKKNFYKKLFFSPTLYVTQPVSKFDLVSLLKKNFGIFCFETRYEFL